MTNFERWKEIITTEEIAEIISDMVYHRRTHSFGEATKGCCGCPLSSNKPNHDCREYVHFANHDDNCRKLLTAWFIQKYLKKEEGK